MRLGELLIDKNLISESQLVSALSRQFSSHAKLGECLILGGFIEESVLLETLAEQLHYGFTQAIDSELITGLSLSIIPKDLAQKWTCIAGYSEPNFIVFANDEIEVIKDFLDGFGLSYVIVLTKRSNIRVAVNQFYL